MTVQKPTRPWYCIDALVDDYVTIYEEGGDLKMLKSLKITRAIVVNIGIIAITLLALAEGAEATIVGGLGLVSLATYNGVEIADYGALVQALAEAGSQSAADESSNDDGGGSP